MRIVALEAIANCRAVDLACVLGGIFISVALQTDLDRRRRYELYAGDIAVDANFMAAQTARRHRRMNSFAFGLVLVALQALLAGDVLFKRHRMYTSVEGQCEETEQ